jgi:hypothetical protein
MSMRLSHVYNHWSGMPSLLVQHTRIHGLLGACLLSLRRLTPLEMSYVAAMKRAKQYTKVDENRHVVLAAFADVFDVGRFDKDIDPGEVREFSTTERGNPAIFNGVGCCSRRAVLLLRRTSRFRAILILQRDFAFVFVFLCQLLSDVPYGLFRYTRPIGTLQCSLPPTHPRPKRRAGCVPTRS